MSLDLGAGLKLNKDENLKAAIKKVFDGLGVDKTNYLESIKAHKKRFDNFISPGKSIPADNFSFLSILRKWNSYTPILSTHAKGGGYFVYHNNTGVVIDPGFNFIQNFFEQNFKIDDIDAILITHAHNDHTVELEAILSLLFKRNRNKPKSKQKKIDIYLNLGSFKKFAAYFDLSEKNKPDYIGNIVLLDSHNEYRILKNNWNSDFFIYTTKTQHHEMITSKYALGFVLKCGDIIIRFTGDTGWNPKIEEENALFLNEKQIDNVDILIPHLGSIETTEFDFDFQKTIKQNMKFFYKQHLGILGCICMVHKYKPGMVIFSEFGEELKDIRKNLIEKISNSLGIFSIPGDIGLYVKIEGQDIFCCKSGNMEPKQDIEIFEIQDNLVFVSKNSFALGERANKQSAVNRLTKKTFIK